MVNYRLAILAQSDAFEDNPRGEISRILREEAERLDREEVTYFTAPLMDINGNVVGNVTFSQ